MNTKTEQVMKLHKPSSSSAAVVGSINDLLIKILLCLPLKSLMRFKLVSKHWMSMITSPYFCLQYYPFPNTAIGLFYSKLRISNAIGYIHLDTTTNTCKPQFIELNFPLNPYQVGVHDCCNGLLLCYSSMYHETTYGNVHNCFVYNPTTKYSTKIPKPGVVNGVQRSVLGLTLAFDPTRSPPSHKVVCVRESEIYTRLRQIEIYSPESDHHEWRLSGKPFESNAYFPDGVYWNGSIYWINSYESEVLCFDVDQERLGKIPMPDRKSRGLYEYFGDSCGHLHLVIIYDDEDYVIVYEMKKDCSQYWFVKYRVSLAPVRAAYQDQMADFDFFNIGGFVTMFNILSIVRSSSKDDDGDAAFLVLSFCPKVLKLDLVSNTFEEIYTLESYVLGSYRPYVYQYIESLHVFPRGPASSC